MAPVVIDWEEHPDDDGEVDHDDQDHDHYPCIHVHPSFRWGYSYHLPFLNDGLCHYVLSQLQVG